ncbi:hypothetical protein [Thalassotalea ganghwensis]
MNKKFNAVDYRIHYVVLLVFVVSVNIFDIYEAFRMAEVPEYEPSNPLWLSLVLFILNILIVVATFGATFKKYILVNFKFWCMVIVVDITAVFLSLYFDILAGGYSKEDAVNASFIAVWFLCIYLFATLRYCLDIKDLNINKAINSEK